MIKEITDNVSVMRHFQHVSGMVDDALFIEYLEDI